MSVPKCPRIIVKFLIVIGLDTSFKLTCSKMSSYYITKHQYFVLLIFEILYHDHKTYVFVFVIDN